MRSPRRGLLRGSRLVSPGAHFTSGLLRIHGVVGKVSGGGRGLVRLLDVRTRSGGGVERRLGGRRGGVGPSVEIFVVFAKAPALLVRLEWELRGAITPCDVELRARCEGNGDVDVLKEAPRGRPGR